MKLEIKIFSCILLLLIISCNFNEKESPEQSYLSKDDLPKLKELSRTKDLGKFIKKTDALAYSGKLSSLYILTIEMFNQPWDKDNFYKSKKRLLHDLLDKIISAPNHDKLTAAYYRSLKKNNHKAVSKAKRNLLNWIKDNENQLKWNKTAKRFSINPQYSPQK